MSIKNIKAELEEEYKRFIEFGGLLDKRMRRYLVQYIQNKFNPDEHLIPELEEEYFEYFKKALDDIFIIEGLQEVTLYNEKLKKQLVLDVLYWMRKAYKKTKTKNPYFDEESQLQSWAVTPLHIFIKRWRAMMPYLGSLYDRNDLDTDFFIEKFRQAIKSADIDDYTEDEKEAIEIIIKNVLSQWDAKLSAKILAFQLEKLREEQESFTELMENKVEEYNKIREFINPFTEYLGWDLSRKLWEDTSFDVLYHYNNLLENEESIKALADLLGNMREAEIEIEEEEIEKSIIRKEWVVDSFSKAAITGVKESDELEHLLSSEAGLLSNAQTEMLFLKKYADKKLMTFRYEDRKLVTSEDHILEINQKANKKEKGPFIICIDTSESMNGEPEKIAKVLSLGILKMAMHENRKAYLINFSTGIQTLDLHDIANSVDEIAHFLQKSFYGGTDATLALYEAIRQLGTNEYEDADVLVISDFIMSKVNDEVLEKIQFHQQNKNTEFHCLTIGKDANQNVLDVFDTNWMYNPKEKGIVKSLTKGFQDISNRM